MCSGSSSSIAVRAAWAKEAWKWINCPSTSSSPLRSSRWSPSLSSRRPRTVASVTDSTNEAIAAAGRQLEHLTLLNHRDLLDRLIGSRNDNLTSPEDHLLPLEGVTLVDPETREAVTRDRYEDGTLVRTQVCEIGDRR